MGILDEKNLLNLHLMFVVGISVLIEAERRRKEEAERKAKLDEIAEKQRQRERELEEKERQWREEVLGRSTVVPTCPSEPPMARPSELGPAVPAAAAITSSPGKYVPRFKRMAESAGQAPPPEPDRWGRGSNRPDDRAPQYSDRWRDDRRPSYGGGGALRSSWSSSRTRGEH